MKKKKDLCAFLRQNGPPTLFLTMIANEIGWTDLLRILTKLKEEPSDLSEETLSAMHFIDKMTLINKDSVTCAIYFEKLVNKTLQILQSKQHSPFGKYRGIDYF